MLKVCVRYLSVCIKCSNTVNKPMYLHEHCHCNGWLWHIYYCVLNGFSNSSPYHLEYLGVKRQMDLQANM